MDYFAFRVATVARIGPSRKSSNNRQAPASGVPARGYFLLAASLLLLSGALTGCSARPEPTVVAAAPPSAGPQTSGTPPSSEVSTSVQSVPSTSLDREATPSKTPAPTLTPTTVASPTATATSTPSPLPPTPTDTPTPAVSPTPSQTPTPLPTVVLSEDIVNILLLGVDSARNLKSQNTDTIIVISVNKATKQVSMLSIPRDLWVYIPTLGWNRINQAHKHGHSIDYPGKGPALLMRTIEVNLGIPIDHWARVDFQGFTRVVDKLGGVEMTIACPVNLRYRPPTSQEQEEMILEAGVHQMNGETALRYVRTRRDGTDFDRARRQQQFLRAMWNQTKSPEIILRIPGLWSALSDAFQTDMSLGDVVALAPVALEINPQRVRSRYIGPRQISNWKTEEGWQVLLPNNSEIQRVVASLFAPPAATEDAVASEGARIQVRNGTYRQQLAKIGADQLLWQGFSVIDTGLADHPDYKQTQVIVFQDKPQALGLLTQLLGVGPENVIHQPDPNQPADFLVILGEDYDPCGR
jgi:LCP family protein required for cell wall assembly